MRTNSTFQAMLMGAGLGTRLKPFSDLSVKFLLPVLGVPLLQYCINSLREAGVSSFVMNIHHLAGQAREGASAVESNIQFSDESDCLLGSAGGLRLASPLLKQGKSFYYVNPDVLCDLDWTALSLRHEELRERHGVVLTLALSLRSSLPSQYREVLYDPRSGLITGLGGLEINKPFFISAAVIEKEALTGVPGTGVADFVKTILLPAIDQGKAGFHMSQSCIWYDIGTTENWFRTQIALLERLEKDDFPNPITRSWEAELKRKNIRLSEGIWVSRETAKAGLETRNWKRPAYWDLQNEGGPASKTKSLTLGPHAIVYGTPPHEDSLDHTITFKGKTYNL